MNPGAGLQFDAVPVRTPANGPLAVELIPAPDPWEVARRLAHLPHLLFLYSAERHEERGRYSYVCAEPVRGRFYRNREPAGRHGCKPLKSWIVLQTLSRLAAKSAASRIHGLPPFQGGFAGLFGYGLCRQFERIPEPHFDEFVVPDIAFGQYEWVISFDHEQGRAWIVTGNPSDATPRHRRVARRVQSLPGLLRSSHWPAANPKANTPNSPRLTPQFPLPGFPGVTSNFDRAGYEAAVRRVVEYIHAGDAFQVNLSQRLLAPLREHPLELYGRLRERNPAPFAAYFDLGDFQILSASPERFLRVFPDGEVETRPIKGTRPRGNTPELDAALIRDLVTNPKDRAENVMIVDLLRNDIGKVCEYGSVRVPRVCEVETFRFVHHLVSEVRGKLRPGLGPLDLLAAAFPGGSVTGAPKVRAMEIIAELEPTARGPYCGCLGWIGFDGAMDTNILIRTFTAGRGWVQFPVGGGIVADSDPAREYEETLHKAAGLLQSLNH
jgi:para-aminobenzoate synthetase component I